jgi:hypothetical protein
MLFVRRQRFPVSASCAGLQYRPIHADAANAQSCRVPVADEPLRKLVNIGAKVVRHDRYVIIPGSRGRDPTVNVQ